MLRSRGIDEDLGTHFLTLELIEGADLRALLRHFRRHGESLDPGLTSYVALVLASAPDFGIAKATNLSGSLQSGAIKGKLPYVNRPARIIEKSPRNKEDPVSGCCVSFLVVSCCVGEIVGVVFGQLTLRSGSPIDVESVHCRHHRGPAAKAGRILSSLRETRGDSHMSVFAVRHAVSLDFTSLGQHQVNECSSVAPRTSTGRFYSPATTCFDVQGPMTAPNQRWSMDFVSRHHVVGGRQAHLALVFDEPVGRSQGNQVARTDGFG